MIDPFHDTDDVVVAPSAVILAKVTLALSQNPATRGSSLKNSMRPKFPNREKIPVRHA
jgi:hypothetical protein